MFNYEICNLQKEDIHDNISRDDFTCLYSYNRYKIDFLSFSFQKFDSYI